MKLIGENIHIISKRTRTAIEEKDKDYIRNLAKKQTDVDWIDLNIGPARKQQGTMRWLIDTVREVSDKPLSFDTTNLDEIKSALQYVNTPQKSLINSTNADDERLNPLSDITAEYGCCLIALTMDNKSGIPKEADLRLEMACKIIEKTTEAGIDNTKIFIDPLVLPVCVDQSQALESLNAIRMFKEAFDPQVNTTIGLSNISNGSPKELRPLINRVYLTMASGCGLDSAIVDACDEELIRTVKMLDSSSPQNSSDELLLNIQNMMLNFDELENISYDKTNDDEVKIFKTAEILMNKHIYSHNYLDV